MEATIEFLKNTLSQKGIRPSYQRMKVLEYLYRNEGHPTVDDIFCAISPLIASFSKTTVYNTLHIFVQAGLVRIVSIDDTELRYDITLSNHGHFICEVCGTIINFAVDFDRIPTDGLNQSIITEKNVYFRGFCPNCLNQSTKIDKENKWETKRS